MLTSDRATSSRILFISHKERVCGVYQYGLNIASALKYSHKYGFTYIECSSADEFLSVVCHVRPMAIIYNYYPTTLPWITRRLLTQIKIPHIGIIHEITQRVADRARADLFDYYIAPDPTLLLRNPIVFKTGRLIPPYSNAYPYPDTPTIGSFGFGLQGKGFERLIITVQEEFHDAVIRLHIPFAAFGDRNGEKSLSVAQRCKDLLIKPGIKLSLSHDFLNQDELLDFLAQNTLNAFFYDQYEGRGLSSVIDYALAVQRPIAITKSKMFRHIYEANPSICIEQSPLVQIINNDIRPLESFYEEWSLPNIVSDYERIVDNILNKKLTKRMGEVSYICKYSMQRIIEDYAPKVISRVRVRISKPHRTNPWIAETPSYGADKYRVVKNIQQKLSEMTYVRKYNRILDGSAREQYRRTIALLYALAPDIIYRKIPEANVQQAFVFDTVLKCIRELPSPRILCVGSYEDTAALSLKRIGIHIDEIDPVLNYDLEEFVRRPSTKRSSYDIIFSTSVVEHVVNDEVFLCEMAHLLAVGGIAILTCDYNDQYRQGDCIPDEDCRMYTQRDLKERLLPLLENCELVDDPQWDCTSPDFTYAGYRYTFATFVFRKVKG
jgi:hypothetical protein